MPTESDRAAAHCRQRIAELKASAMALDKAAEQACERRQYAKQDKCIDQAFAQIEKARELRVVLDMLESGDSALCGKCAQGGAEEELHD